MTSTDPLLKEKNIDELIEIAKLSGIKANKRMKPETIIEKINNSVPQISAVPLRRKVAKSMRTAQKDSWVEVLNSIMQCSIKNLRERLKKNYYVTGIREIESVIFIRSLTNKFKELKGDVESIPAQLALFQTMIGLVSFQVHERHYVCSKYFFKEKDAEKKLLLDKTIIEYQDVIKFLSKQYSSDKVKLQTVPSARELLSILVDHLQESEQLPIKTQIQTDDYDIAIDDVHPARRSAIKDWQTRIEAYTTEWFGHEVAGNNNYTYPQVSLLFPSDKYLILLIVSPLDENFVDEKVTDDHRCVEIALAIFDVENHLYPQATVDLEPQLRQAFARVLFTNMHEETSQALQDSFTAQAAILRHWVTEASKGYQNLIGDESGKIRFDALEFCEAVVESILCADILGIEDREIYSFDRAYILKEAGASIEQERDEPILMKVLEASIRSNHPSDRNQFLTRLERNIRERYDYECDASEKRIEDDHNRTFYIHGLGNQLGLTKKQVISAEKKEELSRTAISSKSAEDYKSKVYRFPIDSENEVGTLELLLENLIGRLNSDNYRDKLFKLTTGEFKTKTFKQVFEDKRLQITEMFDETGLFFHYEHGINLESEIPLLYRLQSAYSEYLNDDLSKDIDQHLQERYRLENLDEEIINQLIINDRKERKRRFEEARKGESIQGQTKSSKVVYISFSWELHDGNMRELRKDSQKSGRDDPSLALMGEEYTYTIILVSDHDPEKSIADLSAERENLKLYFQLIMDRIWQDKLIEKKQLARRSEVIQSSLKNLLHRAKNFVKDKESERILNDQLKRLNRIAAPILAIAKEDAFPSNLVFFTSLLEMPVSKTAQEVSKHNLYEKQAKKIIATDIGDLRIRFSTGGGIPPLRIFWSPEIVKEAFTVILKNACEAAVLAKENRNVEVQLQVVPNFRTQTKYDHFLDIVVENPGGPIDLRLLQTLNKPDPTKATTTPGKEGSTGIGVYISRSQLIETIGNGADLIFTNLENGMVQARLRLPASLVKTEIPQEFPLLEIEREYVLYIEDAEEVYERASQTLESKLESYDVDLFHHRAYKEAEALVLSKMPEIVLSDLTILKEEIGDDDRSMKFGFEFLKSLLRNAKETQFRPPIWILTAEPEKVVRQGLGDIDEYGYRFVPSSSATAKELAKQGIICVFGEKNPAENPLFEQFLDEVFTRTQEKSDSDVIGLTLDSYPLEYDCIIEKVELCNKSFMNDLHEKYSTKIRNKEADILFVEAECKNKTEIVEALRTWYSHDGLLDPDIQTSQVIPLWNHSAHRKLLLLLKAPRDVHKQISARMLFWGLTKNVMFVSDVVDYQAIARQWLQLRMEYRGPLSTLRHDIKNEWWTLKPESLLGDAVKKIDNCETLLSKRDDRITEVERGLLNKKQTSKIISDIFFMDGTENKNKYRKSLDELEKALIEAAHTETNLKRSVDNHRGTIHILRSYLSG